MTHSESDPIIQELRAMKQRMDVLFDESLHQAPPVQAASPSEARRWAPPVDIWETSDAWVLCADLPGVVEEDIVLQVGDGQLSVSGRRTLPEVPALATLHTGERQSGRFQRIFTLPKDARNDHIEAELKGGILTVRVQRKAGESKLTRKIPVQSG